uniref:DNA-directed RNA polymerase n=1 Tax=viral metagenome TaxID=1070528 RepID=A0A6C0CRZ6_9ZZZZ
MNQSYLMAQLNHSMDPTWDIIDRYFCQGGGTENANPLVQHQIESFNEFIDKKLCQIIQGFNSIQICHNYKESVKDFAYKIFINIQNPSLSKPIFQQQDGSQILMTPHIARMNGLTYGVNIYADVHILTETINMDNVVEKNEVKVPSVNVGKIPIMVRSKVCILNQVPGIAENSQREECRYDPGGYFIVNGNEKVIISQDRISENKTLVFSANGCLTDGLNAEIRSAPDGMFLPPKTTSLSLSAKPNHMGRTIRLNTSFLRSEIPLFVMFRVLGVQTDCEILQHILFDMEDEKNRRLLNEMAATVDDAIDIYTQEQALKFIMRYVGITGTPKEYLEQPEQARKILLQVIRNDFLPHVGPSFQRKALYLGYMVRKLMKIYLGYQLPDNRDSYLHKRIDTPGVLISNLFRQCWGKMLKEMRNSIQRELQLWRATPVIPTNVFNASNIHRFIKQSIIDMGIRYALSTGNWGVKTLGSFQNIRTGVAQVLNRMSYLSTLSHLRRINTPMEKNGKLVQPRKLENSQYGVVCPAETPEGSSVGLVKNIALSARITSSMSSIYVRKCINEMGVYVYDDTVKEPAAFLKEMGDDMSVHIMINGDLIGYHRDPKIFYDKMKNLKRRGEIPPTTGICWDVPQNLIMISTEAGRMCRPLYIVDTEEEGKDIRIHKWLRENPEKTKELLTKTFSDFITILDENKEGFIEYLDVDEIDKSMIAMFPKDIHKQGKMTYVPPKYTHCEIHPSLMLGVLACNIPFSDHNQSPRNCYQSAMGKQAVGTYMSNYNQRIDTMAHVLNYPQKPLARTRLSKYTNSDNLPSGMNAVVAIMTKSGFNQEDSVMVNKSALDRGLFASTYYKAYRDQCSKNHSTGEEEQFTKPLPTTSHIKPYNYDKLDDKGFIPKNTYVDDNDIIVGKVMPHKIQGIIFPRDASMVMKTNDSGHVDMSFQGVNSEGYKFIKLRLRKYRKPTIGDKLSSRHGQKGTIGMIYSQEDMPFSKEGITPDIIMNPHAIPSRMTVGQLIECIMGKSASLLGTLGDATPFTECSVEKVATILESFGMERYGNEILYNGRTGEMIHTEIFIGPTFYQRLKHMVTDKIHSRGSNGPVVMLTRQPAEGRARNGGLRFGEMERDAIIAHGASCFLKERMLDVSDNYRVFICKKCGLFCVANPERNIYKCSSCKNQIDISQSRIPYSMKLLMQELMTMGIAPRIIV